MAAVSTWHCYYRNYYYYYYSCVANNSRPYGQGWQRLSELAQLSGWAGKGAEGPQGGSPGSGVGMGVRLLGQRCAGAAPGSGQRKARDKSINKAPAEHQIGENRGMVPTAAGDAEGLDSRGDNAAAHRSLVPEESRARCAAGNNNSAGLCCCSASPRTASSCFHPQSFTPNPDCPLRAAAAPLQERGRRKENKPRRAPPRLFPSAALGNLAPKFPGAEEPGRGRDGAERG